MSSESHILDVYKAGPLTVVGFGGQDVLDQVNIAACREEILELVGTHKTEILAFDLTGVKFVPSGLLGLLASLRHQNIKIQIYNPSDDVQEVLEVTHLNQVLEVCHVEI
jgi:anti-sigma B factor antagonist